jgi:hypothetical protein
MQDSGLRNPSSQDRGEPIPADPCPLAAVNQYIPPQPSSAPAEDAQLSRVAGNSMVLVVTQHDLSKPRTDFGRTVMLPALKFSLDGFQLRDHPLLSRYPPYGECPRGELPTKMGKPRKVRVSGFPSPRCFRFRAARRPNSISLVLSECNSKPNFARRS